MWSKKFWLDVTERAGRTFAQSLLATITVGQAIYDVDWQAGLGIAATATVVSVLASMSASRIGDRSTAAIMPEGQGVADQ